MSYRFGILIVDDEAAVRALARDVLSSLPDCSCETVASAEEALDLVRQGDVNLILTDLQMPGMSGADLLVEMRRLNPDIPVLIMTGFATLDGAVKLFRQGAYDYVCKPFSVEELRGRVSHALQRLRLLDEIRSLRQLVGGARAGGDIIAVSKVMLDLVRTLPSIARTSATVLIRGETGTGKEVVARALHALSPRAGHPFVALNCGALPESLLESEIFGHVKGAFTDARENHAGLIQAADGGTFFLDEVGEMPGALQVKLLRFLQDKEVRQVGSAKSRQVDVRIIAATHRDLSQAMAAGTFREDLFYRLNILPITVPPLRERKEDIPPLVEHFLRQRQAEGPTPVRSFSPLALQRLMNHDWPGNVRELENKVQQILALATNDVVLPGDVELPPGPETIAADGRLKPFKQAKVEAIAAFEVDYVKKALLLSGGNISKAARLAGKHRRALWELVRVHRIPARRAEP